MSLQAQTWSKDSHEHICNCHLSYISFGLQTSRGRPGTTPAANGQNQQLRTPLKPPSLTICMCLYTSLCAGSRTRGRLCAMRWELCLATADTAAAADWPVCCHCLQVIWLNPLFSSLNCCDAFTGEKKGAFDHRQQFTFPHWGMNKKKYFIGNICKNIFLCYRKVTTKQR